MTGKHVRGPVDVAIKYHGSLYLLRPLSPAAEAWFEENVQDNAAGVWANAIVVGPRYLGDILQGLRADGLVAQ